MEMLMCGAQSFMSLSVFLFAITLWSVCDFLWYILPAAQSTGAAKHQEVLQSTGVLQSTKGCCKAPMSAAKHRCLCVCVHMCAEPHIKLNFWFDRSKMSACTWHGNCDKLRNINTALQHATLLFSFRNAILLCSMVHGMQHALQHDDMLCSMTWWHALQHDMSTCFAAWHEYMLCSMTWVHALQHDMSTCFAACQPSSLQNHLCQGSTSSSSSSSLPKPWLDKQAGVDSIWCCKAPHVHVCMVCCKALYLVCCKALLCVLQSTIFCVLQSTTLCTAKYYLVC